ncbi:MAG: hypothetical protein NT023_04545 [Armatimonadetes bacterium]|nr:hypothetical protein [Armatimonadota bacterium]
MNRCVVVTEGETDARILRPLLKLPSDDNSVKVTVAGGWSSAESLSRSILMNGKKDVVLVVDADASDDERFKERVNFHKERMEGVDTRTSKWLVVVVKPEIEVLFFRDRDTLEAFVGRIVTDEEYFRGQYEPRRILKALLGEKSLADFETRLTPQILESLRNQPEIQMVVNFLKQQGYTPDTPQVAHVA